MPIAVDPESLFPFVLESDKGKPSPPTFLLKPLTVREFRKAVAVDADVQAAATTDAAITIIMDGIRLGLRGWRNVTDSDGKPIDYSPEALEDVIEISEAKELMRAVQDAGALLAEAKKNSGSLPSSSMDSSAKSADQESASTAPAS